MLSDLELEVAEVTEVAPRKMDRRKEELPAAIKVAYDQTEMGKAREITVRASAGAANMKKLATRLLSLLKSYASEQGTVAFKASSHPEETGPGTITLYWQKKPLRQKAQPVEPAILPAPPDLVPEDAARGEPRSFSEAFLEDSSEMSFQPEKKRKRA